MPLSLDGSSGITGAINVQATGSILAGVTTVAAGSASAPSITPTGDNNTGIFFPAADTIAFAEGGTEVARFDSSGRFGVGTATPSGLFDARGFSYLSGIQIRDSSHVAKGYVQGDSRGLLVATDGAVNIAFDVNATERARIDSSGRLLVGTSTARDNYFSSASGQALQFQVEGTDYKNSGASFTSNATSAGWSPHLAFGRSRGTAIGSNTIVNADDSIGTIVFHGNDGSKFVQSSRIDAFVDGTPGTNDMPGRLVFSTTADGANSPTERMRITNGGFIQITDRANDPLPDSTTPSASNAFDHLTLSTSGVNVSRQTAPAVDINRRNTDGDLVLFRQDGTQEGSISVSGTTVSYNGAHISRWSQLINIDPHDKTQRPEIPRGTVMSNLDEMCQWIDPETGEEQDNEQLNKTQISTVEDDPNVAGVFQSWDDDDDTWVNDYYLAMTGDFVIRIAADTTVNRGDLLISAGDGTAKPQGDRYLKDSTIAKVTSIHVTCTYDDGSYCVPCVLMAC